MNKDQFPIEDCITVGRLTKLLNNYPDDFPVMFIGSSPDYKELTLGTVQSQRYIGNTPGYVYIELVDPLEKD